MQTQPITLETRRGPFGIQLRSYHVHRPVRSVRLVDRWDPTRYAIVHPSTRELGRWQISWFDALGAVGDRRADSLAAAMADGELAQCYDLTETM